MATLGEIQPEPFNRQKYPESPRGFSAGGGRPTLGGGQNFTMPGREGMSTIPKGQNIMVRGNSGMALVPPGTDGVTVGEPRRPQALRTTRPAALLKPTSNSSVPRLGGPPELERVNMNEAINNRARFAQGYSDIDPNAPKYKTSVQDDFAKKPTKLKPTRLSKFGGKLGLLGAGIEGYDVYQDSQVNGMTGIDQAGRVAEGAGRVSSAGLGAALGSAAGPVGAVVGGIAGYMAPDAAKSIYNYFAENDIELPSEKADQLREAMARGEEKAQVENSSVDEASIMSLAPDGRAIPEVGSKSSRIEHQKILDKYNLSNTPASTDPSVPGDGTTENNRNAFITQEQPDSEGNNLGVSLGDTGSVTGLRPEQATRIQNSLSQGKEIPSSGALGSNAVNAERSATDDKIMQAFRSGAITANKASALMNRDTTAADRMDRLGGGAGSYIKPDAQPRNPTEAMAYGQNINNFTRNGELGRKEALIAQRTYLKSLGGYDGTANSGQKKSDSKFVMQKNYDQGGIVTSETPYSFNPNTNAYNKLNAGENNSPELAKELLDAMNDPNASEQTKQKSSNIFERVFGVSMKDYAAGNNQ